MTREEIMTEQYGEAVTKAQAARMLNSSRNTIYLLLKEGKIKLVCGGTRIDVRSIAEYIGHSDNQYEIGE